jgi:hypothetical protein
LPFVHSATEVLLFALRRLVLEKYPVPANALVSDAASLVVYFEFGLAIAAKGNILGCMVVAELAQERKAGPLASCPHSHPLSVRIQNFRFRDHFSFVGDQAFFPARFSSI